MVKKLQAPDHCSWIGCGVAGRVVIYDGDVIGTSVNMSARNRVVGTMVGVLSLGLIIGDTAAGTPVDGVGSATNGEAGVIVMGKLVTMNAGVLFLRLSFWWLDVAPPSPPSQFPPTQ